MAKFNIKKIGKAVQPAALSIVGGVGAKYIPKFVPIADERIKKASALLLGIILSASKEKSPLHAIGIGMVAVSGTDLVAQMTGIGAVDYDQLVDELDINGLNDVITGQSDVINGAEMAEEQKFDNY